MRYQEHYRRHGDVGPDICAALLFSMFKCETIYICLKTKSIQSVKLLTGASGPIT
jgi:hypothetical protein